MSAMSVGSIISSSPRSVFCPGHTRHQQSNPQDVGSSTDEQVNRSFDTVCRGTHLELDRAFPGLLLPLELGELHVRKREQPRRNS